MVGDEHSMKREHHLILPDHGNCILELHDGMGEARVVRLPVLLVPLEPDMPAASPASLPDMIAADTVDDNLIMDDLMHASR